MRTIKFRAWDKQKKKMLADEELFFQRKVVHEDGFKDKNDTEIYEGDIVRWSYRDASTDAVCSEVAEVVFHKGTWSRKVQIPPDLVVNLQPVDIAEVIL